MADFKFEVVMNIDHLRPFLLGGEFKAFGEIIDPFGEVLHRVVWAAHHDRDSHQDLRLPEISLQRVHYGSPLSVAATVKHQPPSNCSAESCLACCTTTLSANAGVSRTS